MPATISVERVQAIRQRMARGERDLGTIAEIDTILQVLEDGLIRQRDAIERKPKK